MNVNRHQLLPYRIAPVRFPFPALAALAGRLPLGGGREIALAVLSCVRLAAGATAPYSFAVPERSARAAGARVWLASMALPVPIRTALTRCIDASTGAPAGIAASLRALIAATADTLDGPSIVEIEQLVQRLTPQL